MFETIVVSGLASTPMEFMIGYCEFLGLLFSCVLLVFLLFGIFGHRCGTLFFLLAGFFSNLQFVPHRFFLLNVVHLQVFGLFLAQLEFLTGHIHFVVG